MANTLSGGNVTKGRETAMNPRYSSRREMKRAFREMGDDNGKR